MAGPVSGNDILQYQGNVALGLNADGLAQYGDTDTKDLQQNVFALAYLNSQKNRAVWEQKIKERDDALDQISNGKLDTGAVMQENMPELLKLRDNVKKYFFDNVGDLKSDPRKWLEYNNLISDWNRGKVMAQSKYIESSKEMAAAAKEVNPVKKKAMLDNIEANKKKGLYDMYQPYQQTLDFDPKRIYQPLPTKILQQGRQGDYDITVTGTDLDKARRLYYNMYNFEQDGDDAHNMDQFADSWLGNDGLRPRDVVTTDLDLVNKKLDKINTELGLKPGDAGFLTPLQVGAGPNGKLQFADIKPEAVYKIALATTYGKATDRKLNLDYSKLNREKSQTAADYALVNQRNAAADLSRAKAKTAAEKTKALKETFTPKQNFDELAQKTTTYYRGKTPVTVVQWDDISAKTREYLGIDPLTSGKGKNRFIELKPANIKVGNNLYTEDDVNKLYEKVKDKFPTIFDYLNAAQATFDVEVQGREKGNLKYTRANRLMTYQNQAKEDAKNKKELLEEDNTPAEQEQ